MHDDDDDGEKKQSHFRELVPWVATEGIKSDNLDHK